MIAASSFGEPSGADSVYFFLSSFAYVLGTVGYAFAAWLLFQVSVAMVRPNLLLMPIRVTNRTQPVHPHIPVDIITAQIVDEPPLQST
jgi:hypothetical protein